VKLLEYLSLYRKWRPQSFGKGFVGQEHVVRTLRNALNQNQVAHAYLFTGPRGTGKTSAAKILAKAVNCTERGENPDPCNHCPSCQRINDGVSLDVLEIDGASNRGIDEIRELREKVKFAPVEGNYKVYIIDEVHMLTTEAFNALLKTLEEPPSHVIFIFATTEIHKVPSTILSRCQRFDFKRLTSKEIFEHLSYLVKQENYDADEDALWLIGSEVDGGLRDAIGLLEQSIAYAEGKLTTKDVRTVLGLVENEALFDLARAVATHDLVNGFQVINKAQKEGKDLALFSRQAARFFRDLLLLLVVGAEAEAPVALDPSEKESAKEIAESIGLSQLQKGVDLFLDAGISSRRGSEGSLPLEMAFIHLVTEEEEASSYKKLIRRLDRLEERMAILEKGTTQLPRVLEEKPKKSEKVPELRSQVISEKEKPASTIENTSPISEFEFWEEVLEEVKEKKRTVEALLREGKPKGLRGNQLEIEFTLRFHWEKIREPGYSNIVREALEEVTGKQIIPKFILLDKQAKKEENQPELLRKSLELFGGEVKEIEEEDI
jgi:DNA polymerase-3 subunit gamma/tau